MGALAPVSPWIPEDDLLLKNAVEAGASLESLAKGAVQFSRKFTVQELQDRWFSLLYDPVVSAEASACMIKFEHSASPLPSKFNRFANSKENKCVTGKRKVESVCSRYYALRKRICNEPFNSMDLSFLVEPNDNNYVVNGDEHLSANCIPGDPTSNPFGFEGSDMDAVHNAFPHNMIDCGDETVHNFHLGVQNPVAEDFPIEQNNTHNEMPHIFGENLSLASDGTGIEDLGQSKELPVCDFFKSDELGMKSPSAFDHIKSEQPNMCSEFEGNKVFNSPISECGTSFSCLDYSSPLPVMSMWRTPALPADIGLKDKDLCNGGYFERPDGYDANNMGTSGYNVPLNIMVKTEMDLDDFKGDSNPEGFLAELSDSLMNFTNEDELLFMNDDKYYDGLSSLLLNSPNDAGQENMNCITEADTSVAPDVCTTSSAGADPGELDDNRGSHNVNGPMSCSSETQMQSSVLTSSLQFPKLKDGVINCTLNTEDPEIPCNDDIFIPHHLSQVTMPSTAERKFQEANNTNSSSSKDFSGIQKTGDRGPSLLHRERNAPGKSHASPQILGSNMQESGSKPPLGNFGVKYEVSKTDSTHVASRAVGIASGGPNHISTENVRKTDSSEKHEGSKESVFGKHLNSSGHFIEKQAFDSESFKSYSQTNATGIKEEHDVSITARDHQSVHAELASMNVAVPDPALNPPTPEQDGLLIEGDNDVPCYSDIEAMICDMDLDPDDQDSFASEEVSRYEDETTKRTIIRLEQGAHSCMQRAIASHGALALLYGRHSRHYIKKSEVLLGRATEDFNVDIDLGREGRTNKISRRQATIKLGRGGLFHLRNLGKSAIYISGKQVGPGQGISLNSNCLIEISGMPFTFVTNQLLIKQYLDGIS